MPGALHLASSVASVCSSFLVETGSFIFNTKKPMISLRSSLRAAAALALVCAAGLAQAQAYVSGSVSGQLAPGVYGRVDIGNAGPPPLLYAQPMMAAPPAVAMHQAPQYMWVPPGHSRDWRRYCGRYNACGQSVYFLRDAPRHWHGDRGPARDPRWNRSPYEYRGDHGHGHGRDHGHGHGRDHGRDRDDDRRNWRGPHEGGNNQGYNPRYDYRRGPGD